MHAIVLVGGFGTRLRPLTSTRPKQMLPLLDRPMIEWVVEHLARFGVDDVVLSLGYLPDAFRAAYPDGRCCGARLRYAVEPEPLDTAGAIRFAARHAGLDERFVVVNGDVIADVDLGALLALHVARGAEATIHLAEVEDPARYGVVPIDDAGRVLAFIEKPAAADAPTRWVNAGTYVLEASVLDRIPEGRRVSIERETFPALVAEGSLFAVQDDGYWIDAGTPECYVQVQLDLAARDGGREGGGAGYRHPTAVVRRGAHVERSVLMARTVVEAGAEVVGSVLLPGAVVASGARVAASVLGEGATAGPGALVLDGSLVGDGALVPPGEHRRARLGVEAPDSPSADAALGSA
ncbi:MAG: NTP transferase domain-containing protein [Acidimicrobiia bacterium]|nr:NTP transferase domain-containing protein [Acidimicrobiia bacterium]